MPMTFVKYALHLAAIAVALPSSAQAAWHKASSKHFIIYSEQKPADLKAYAEKLERFDKAVRVGRVMADPEVGDGNRLTLFLLRDVDAVHDTMPTKMSWIQGYYMGRASGSVAFVPLRTGSVVKTGETTFFHEYAHHLLAASFARPVPTWFNEGFAEFMSTAKVNRNGSVDLGLPANHRAYALQSPQAVHMSITDLLGGRQPASDAEMSSLYARGWLLTHYFYFAASRSGQLSAYLDKFAGGATLAEAARTSFGDLKLLDRDVDSYLRKAKFPYINLPAERLPIGPVSVSSLSQGANAAMPLYIRLQSRAKRPAVDQAAEARKIAAAYPNDFHVQMTLAEAEWVNKDFAAAERAADKAISLMPDAAEAHIWKGRSLLSRAGRGQASALYPKARAAFLEANRLDPENPEPLLYFHRSFVEQGQRPTANAVEALHYAAKLAPQDLGLAMTSATQHLRDVKPDKARPILLLVAQHPHGGALGQRAAALLRQMKASPNLAASPT